jgi:hypothetical protein
VSGKPRECQHLHLLHWGRNGGVYCPDCLAWWIRKRDERGSILDKVYGPLPRKGDKP